MTTKEQGLADIDASGIAARQRWQHWKGGVYTVVGTGLVEKTLDPVVMYAGADGVVWVRSLFVFAEEVSPGTPRFTRIEDDAARLPCGCWAGRQHSKSNCAQGLSSGPCAFSEGVCKSADCPEHGIFPREPAHPMMPRPRVGRCL